MPMNRREFGRQVGAGLGAAVLARLAAPAARAAAGEAAAPGAARPADARPNVLFLAADDLRGTAVSCFGDPVAKTPHLDALAARGTLFNRAYCQQPICNPSRASLMTGRRPDSLRVWNLGTHFRDTLPDVVTLPQWFMRHGYFARSVGKIYHNGNTRIKGDPASWSVPQELYWANHNKDDFARVPQGTAPPEPAIVPTDEIRDVPDDAHLDGRVAEAAIGALNEAAGRKEPFFLGVGFWKPHRPFNAPKRYWDLYRQEDIPPPRPPVPPEASPALATVSQYTDYAAIVKKDPGAIPELRRGYYAAISYMDAQLGKVVAELDRLGLADNTIVVFWADHGYQQGEHGMWGKTSCFEHDARVPLIVVPPRRMEFPRGTRTQALVELLDVYPTLVELAGLPPAESLEGVSLMPLIRDPSASVQAAAFTQHPRPWTMWPADYGNQADAMGYSVRTPAWRYTEWRAWLTGEVLARELYDEQGDPEESRNRAGDPALAGVLRDLEGLLARQVGTAPPSEIAGLA